MKALRTSSLFFLQTETTHSHHSYLCHHHHTHWPPTPTHFSPLAGTSHQLWLLDATIADHQCHHHLLAITTAAASTNAATIQMTTKQAMSLSLEKERKKLDLAFTKIEN